MFFDKPSGVITLITDFGHQQPFVGVMKGRILGRFAAASIVDLTHEILVHWPAEAGFWLARSYESFPAGTVHVAVVDPGVGTSREIAVVCAAGHVFLAPDNGLLEPVVAARPDAEVRRLDPASPGRFRLG
jgi:S-adenosyl-L-methionine hydrolase (adenosine-forming)